MSDGSVLKQLLNIENKRAFPNQFHIKITGDSTTYVQNFHFYAVKVSLGAYKLDAERIISSQTTLLKKATIPDLITITVKESHDWNTLQYFYNWYTTAYYNPKTNRFISGLEGKRKTFEISALRPYDEVPYSIGLTGDGANNNTVGLKVIVKNALLVSTISLPSFNMEEFRPIEHSFTIQSDSIEPVFGAPTIDR